MDYYRTLQVTRDAHNEVIERAYKALSLKYHPDHVAAADRPFHLAAPKVIKVNLTGRLRGWVTAKDVILKVLQIFGTKGNVGCVFEYGGPGVATLDVPERATITNMGAECGVTSSVFPSDETTPPVTKMYFT